MDGPDQIPVRLPSIKRSVTRVPEPKRRRPSLLSLMTIGLAIATAVVLTQIANLLVTPVATVDRGHAHRLVVHRFYDAVNTTLATGDPSDLNDLVAPTLPTSTSNLRAGTGRTRLIEHLLSLHRSQPTLQFRVRDIFADASTAIAWVEMEGASADLLLGTSLGGMNGESIDRMTIVEGQIIELHGILWDITPSVLLAQADVQRPAPDAQIGIARMTLDGHTAPFALSALGPILIAVESGSVKVRGGTSGTWSRVADGPGFTASTIDIGETWELSSGDQFISHKGSPFVLLNDGPTPASVLVVAVIPLPEWTRGTSGNDLNVQRSTIIVMMNMNDDTLSQTNHAFPPGVRTTRLALQFASLNDRAYTLRLERMALAPGTEIRMQSQTAARVIAVEHATAGLIIQQQGELDQQGVVSVMTTDSLRFVQPPGQATVRNLDERTATLLVLSWQ